MDYLGLADRSWPLLRRLTGVHTTAYRATRGLIPSPRWCRSGSRLLQLHLRGAPLGGLLRADHPPEHDAEENSADAEEDRI